jgi:hypothetical protein
LLAHTKFNQVNKIKSPQKFWGKNVSHISLEKKCLSIFREHQSDKMGEYFLWGYFNERPVYQHVSGLDFLYFHKNNVWGAGPKIGGNSAGLLNFGRHSCPYKLGELQIQ